MLQIIKKHIDNIDGKFKNVFKFIDSCEFIWYTIALYFEKKITWALILSGQIVQP